MDQVVSAAPSSGSAAPAPQSAPQTPAAPAGQAAQPPSYATDIAKEFGGTPRPTEPQPDQQMTDIEDPAQAGHPADAVSPVPATPAAKGEPVVAPQGEAPDADLALFESLQIQSEAQPDKKQGEPETSELPVSDDAFEKAVNPDGQATSEQRVKNAQSLLGKWSQELGEHRKAIAEVQVLFDRTPQGLRPKVDGLIKLAELVDPHQLNAALAEKLKVKLVPLDFNPAAQEQQVDADERAVADALIAGTEFTFEEKLAEIQSDPAKKREFDRALRRLERDRENQAFMAQQQAQQEAQRMAADNDQKIASFFDSLRKLPYYEADLKPAIAYWQKQIPDVLPLDLRLNLLKTLAVASRVPKVMKDREAKIRESVTQDLLRKMQLGEPIGEIPMHVDTGRAPGQPGAGGDRMSPQSVTKELASAFL